MGATKPDPCFKPIPFGGVWNDGKNPSKVGSNGITACLNNTYRRYGSWGKRTGSAPVYAATVQGPNVGAPQSGIRWHASFPTPLTQLIVSAQGSLWKGGDPNAVTPSPLTKIVDFQSVANTPLQFAPVRDPAANAGAGADVLIITGATLTGGGFGTGILNTGSFVNNPQVASTITVQVVSGIHTVSVSYTVLQGDTGASVASALAALVNSSPAVTPGTPFLSQAIATFNSNTSVGDITLYALNGGVGGNSITAKITSSGGTFLGGPTSATPFTGGGTQYSGPLKWDGTTLSGLSGAITQAFTGCVAWHNHVWYWGDKNNPDTLYASDIDQPEGWNFMTQEGGYEIGPGDGDPQIQQSVPIGNLMYVLKRNSIFAVSGYDFQSGEYQFNIQPAVQGYGIPSSECVTVLNNAMVFWSGSEFNRLAVGSFEPEYIGRPIPIVSGNVALGDQQNIRAVAGNFTVKSHLNDVYNSVGPPSVNELFTNVVLFGVSLSFEDPTADTVLVYDDDASNVLLDYAWAPWRGSAMNIGAWIPFSNGLNSAGDGNDPPILLWINPLDFFPMIYQLGADAGADTGTAIEWAIQTGWTDCGTPALQKELHQMYLDIEATPGATISCSVTASGPVNGTAQTIYPPRVFNFPPTVGDPDTESAQVLLGKVNPFLKGYKYLFQFSETNTETSFEISAALLIATEEAFLP